MGVPELAVVCDLQLLCRHVKMAYRDSEESFGGEGFLAVNYKGQVLENPQNFLESPSHGCGQGNGAGPTFGY